MNRFSSCLVVLCAIFGVLVHYAAAQNVHVVGNEMGWDIPSNNSALYADWVSDRTFMVGDILEFNFMTNQHDVLQVPQASYTACTQDNAIGTVITAGPANITLNSTGDHYYICTFGRHCQSGQKLAVTVVSSTPGDANPPSTAPTATPTTPATPSPASTQPDAGGPSAAMIPPPPDSASTSLAAGFLLSLLPTGIALIF